MTEEIWKDVVGYEGLYQVSNLGRVRSLTRRVASHNQWGNCYSLVNGRIMKPLASDTGHCQVQLCKDGAITPKGVHRLVLEAFVGPCPDGMECRHYPDQNPGNNKLDNLRWDTPKNNAHDRLENNTSHHGEGSRFSKLTKDQVLEIRRRRAAGEKLRDLAIEFGITDQCVHRIHYRQSWKHLPQEQPNEQETNTTTEVCDDS